MGMKQRIRAKASTETSDAARQSLLPPRPFSQAKSGVSLSGNSQTPDSEARQERAKPSGFSFDQMQIQSGKRKSQGGGRSLPEALRRKMEAAFNTDFSAVRVHEDGRAFAMGALAYTRGDNIYFAPGEYKPGSASGQKMIGHELTHVLQQRAGRVAVPQGKGTPINSDPQLEAEADAHGALAAQGKRVTAPAAQLARRPTADAIRHSPVQCVKESPRLLALKAQQEAEAERKAKEARRIKAQVKKHTGVFPFTKSALYGGKKYVVRNGVLHISSHGIKSPRALEDLRILSRNLRRHVRQRPKGVTPRVVGKKTALGASAAAFRRDVRNSPEFQRLQSSTTEPLVAAHPVDTAMHGEAYPMKGGAPHFVAAHQDANARMAAHTQTKQNIRDVLLDDNSPDSDDEGTWKK